MFEQALILRAGVDKRIDLGLVAETLFLYGSTHFLLERSSLIALTKNVPPDTLLSLFERDAVKMSYLRQSFSVLSAGMPKCHNFGAFVLGGTDKGNKINNYQEEILETLEREHGKSKETTRLATEIADRTKLHRFKGVPRKENAVCDLARTDVSDESFLREAIKVTLRELVPEYHLPDNFRYRLMDTGSGYAVDSDLNYEAINRVYHRTVPPSHSSITDGYLLAHLLEARADTFFAAYYMAELVAPPLNSQLIRLKHFEFLRRRQTNEEEVEQFKELIIPDFPTIREAINSGERSFAEFLKLLDEAEKFKEWLQKTNPDVGLVQEYHKSATQKTWADKLPTKATRFFTAMGLGALVEAIAPSGIGAIAGVGVGGADAFFLDRLIKGWRPNQFIEGPYKEFVTGKGGS